MCELNFKEIQPAHQHIGFSFSKEYNKFTDAK